MPFFKSVLYVFFLGVASHFIGEALPRKWFHGSRFPFKAWKWEREGQIWKCVGVHRWKDIVPDMSKLSKKMVPKRFDTFPTAKSVRRLIRETCVAEVVHVALCLTSPVLWCFWQNYIGVILSAIAVVGNIPFIIIQRYNRPTLLALEKRLSAREAKRRATDKRSKRERSAGTP